MVSGDVHVMLVGARVLERLLDRELLNIRRGDGDERDVHPPCPLHGRALVFRDRTAAVAEHEAKTVIERKEKGDGAFRCHASITPDATLAYARELRSLLRGGRSSGRSQRRGERLCYMLR